MEPLGIQPLVDEGMRLPDFRTIGANVMKNVALNEIGKRVGLENLGQTILGTSINPIVGISTLVGRSGVISNYLQNKRMQKQMMADQRRNEINQIQQRLDNQGTSPRDDYMGGGGAPTSTKNVSSSDYTTASQDRKK